MIEDMIILEFERQLNNGMENISIYVALFIIKSLTILSEPSINYLQNIPK